MKCWKDENEVIMMAVNINIIKRSLKKLNYKWYKYVLSINFLDKIPNDLKLYLRTSLTVEDYWAWRKLLCRKIRNNRLERLIKWLFKIFYPSIKAKLIFIINYFLVIFKWFMKLSIIFPFQWHYAYNNIKFLLLIITYFFLHQWIMHIILK